VPRRVPKTWKKYYPIHCYYIPFPNGMATCHGTVHSLHSPYVLARNLQSPPLTAPHIPHSSTLKLMPNYGTHYNNRIMGL